VKHNDEFRSLESEEDVFTISFEAALALLRAPKVSRRRQPQKKVLREVSKDGSTLKILSGRYGPYVTDGTTNASIPKTANPDTVTFEQAMELLEARRNAAPSARRGAGGGGRRRPAAAAPRAPRRKAASA
jgi:DNA topoisomerase-1